MYICTPYIYVHQNYTYLYKNNRENKFSIICGRWLFMNDSECGEIKLLRHVFSAACVKCLFPAESIGNAGANAGTGVSGSSACFHVYYLVWFHIVPVR